MEASSRSTPQHSAWYIALTFLEKSPCEQPNSMHREIFSGKKRSISPLSLRKYVPGSVMPGCVKGSGFIVYFILNSFFIRWLIWETSEFTSGETPGI